MAVNKVTLNGDVLIDLTADTVASVNLLTGYQATGRDGVKVQGAYVPSSASFTTGSADPSESAQHITPPSGYDGFSYFDVGAVSSDYVGSNITQRSSSDLTASGSKVTVLSGYYAAAASKTIASGTLNEYVSIPSINPTWTVNSSTGIISVDYGAAPGIQPIATSGYFNTGEYIYPMVTMDSSYQLTTKAAATYTPSASTQIISSGVFLTGPQTIEAIPISVVGHTLILPEGLIGV